MNYRIFYFLISVIFFLSCSNQDEISKFESILGTEKSESLTNLIYTFENEFLEVYYPSLPVEDAYRAFLLDVRNSDFEYWKKFSDNLKSHFKKGELEIDIYQIPDSVWIKSESKELYDEFMVRYKYLDSTNKISYIESELIWYPTTLTTDSILVKPRHYSRINLSGNYSRALEAVSKSSDFLTEYVDRRKAAGKVEPVIIADMLLDYNVDATDYFIKRIIVLDIVF